MSVPTASTAKVARCMTIGLTALMLIGLGPAGAAERGRDMPDSVLPADVRVFRAKRARCDHFRDEEPVDRTRAAFLQQALARSCKGTDAALATLRKRYARRPAVLAFLSRYDDSIE